MKLHDLAEKLACRLEGDGEMEIRGVAGMEHASAGHLTFLANPKYAPKVRHTKASAILVSEALTGMDIACLVSENPYLDFARALALFYQPPRPEPGIHPLAYVAPSATVGENCSIGPFAVVGERVRIGKNAVLHPHVVIYEAAEIGDDFLAHSHATVREFCRIGHRVILQNGVVIGGDGFGFARRADGVQCKIVQSGVTILEDDVEVQSLTSVDRATVGETRLKRGAKIDSLVQVGHACTVGEDNIICAQTGLAGSTVLERNVVLAGQVGSSGHLTVHEGAVVYAQSGIGGDVEKGDRISGSPAFAANDWLRAVTAFQKLPELLKTVRELKRKVDELNQNA
jgi:UDP-3-O-[3-hydroxymyristoyl] glucosamine N-acyltransferase